MIIEYKNNEGYIYAYISWNIIDKNNWLHDEGETVSISGAWVHPEYRNARILKDLISDLFYHPSTKNCYYVLTMRDKYPDRPNKLVTINKYLKYVKLREKTNV